MPGDFRVKQSEMMKISKYQDLAMEINKMWKTKARVIQIVIGLLGEKHFLLGSAHILGKVLAIPV